VRIIKIILKTFVFIFLTFLTQIGGLVYLLSLLIFKQIDKKINNKASRVFSKLILFFALYSIATFVIVPIIAKPFGRVQLPVMEKNHLKPLSFFTCFLNRNYVRSELRNSALEVAIKMNNKFPGTTLNYLDANFPFINGFPLVPHLSHNDGKKLDFAFFYIDKRTGMQTNKTPSAIGYGVSEVPRVNENNTAEICAQKGYWQYSLLMKIVPQSNKQNFTFDSTRTKELVNLFIEQPAIGKIFIEPHLKARLKLSSDKIRFHGCQAVRHDDHVHVQLK